MVVISVYQTLYSHHYTYIVYTQFTGWVTNINLPRTDNTVLISLCFLEDDPDPQFQMVSIESKTSFNYFHPFSHKQTTIPCRCFSLDFKVVCLKTKLRGNFYTSAVVKNITVIFKKCAILLVMFCWSERQRSVVQYLWTLVNPKHRPLFCIPNFKIMKLNNFGTYEINTMTV